MDHLAKNEGYLVQLLEQSRLPHVNLYDEVLCRSSPEGAMMNTASSVGATAREMMIWSRSTAAAAITTGSMLVCGIELCAPRPKHWCWGPGISSLA